MEFGNYTDHKQCWASRMARQIQYLEVPLEVRKRLGTMAYNNPNIPQLGGETNPIY